MAKTLPKGHLACLSSAFRYTLVKQTNVANTSARIARGLKAQESRERLEPLPVLQRRPFSRETIASA